MDAIRQTQKRYGSSAMMAAIFIGLFFILAGQKPIGKGLILGTIFSVINFIVMAEILPAKIGQSRNRTFLLSFSSTAVRYALLAVPLILAIKLDRFHLLSTVIGMFMIQFVILSDHFLKHLFPARDKQA